MTDAVETELTHVVRVGAGPINPAETAHELSGFDLVGPMSKEQAEAYVKEVREHFNTINNDCFVYGHPIAEVRRLLKPVFPSTHHRAHSSTAEQVAANWHTEGES